jgi:hypothetical protein
MYKDDYNNPERRDDVITQASQVGIFQEIKMTEQPEDQN